MLSLLPGADAAAPLTVLCLGAHCDDIDIGCGGALLSLLAARSNVSVTWVTFSGNEDRLAELQASANLFLAAAARREVIAHSFRDGFFPAEFSRIKERFEELKHHAPDLVFTHRRADMHQDHRIVSELTWNTFRNHLILEYEVPKYEGDLTTPNVYIELTAADLDRKVEYLRRCYVSQHTKGWFTDETFRALARIRGLEAASSSGWAEGFHVRKQVLRWTAK